MPAFRVKCATELLHHCLIDMKVTLSSLVVTAIMLLLCL